MSDIIDESREVPRISGRRIHMLNILNVIENNCAEENFEFWNLTDEEIEVATEYYEEHEEELKELQEQKTPEWVEV